MEIDVNSFYIAIFSQRGTRDPGHQGGCPIGGARRRVRVRWRARAGFVPRPCRWCSSHLVRKQSMAHHANHIAKGVREEADPARAVRACGDLKT